MKAWMRILTVSFTSSKLKKKLVFGENYLNGRDDLNIDIVSHKYMSPLKDTCTIKISNLRYSEIVQLIQGEYYSVEVKAGYRSSGAQTIFKGGVLYISNSLGDRKTSTAIILCASDLVAKFGQSRINLSLNSGINLYSALNFVCRRAGIPNANISTQFKKNFLQDVMSINDTPASWVNKLCETNNTFIANSDSITDSVLMLYDSAKSNARVIKLDSNLVNLTGGFPQLTKDGLTLNLQPTFAFMCGDVVEVDNSIIDISTTTNTPEGISKGYYLDRDGLYTIYEMQYHLQNRGPNFSLQLTCKSRSLVSNITGGIR